MKKTILLFTVLIGASILYFMIGFISGKYYPIQKYQAELGEDSSWIGPNLSIEPLAEGEDRSLLVYGQDLIANTAVYLGPKGKVAKMTNGMNCQNCHLQAGRQAFGNNYGAVASTYPKFRERSGKIENLYKRVADCMERSLNGVALDSNSLEYKAMEAYILWLGKSVKKGEKPKGSGIEKLAYLNRAANPIKGKEVYQTQCKSCHGSNGEGLLTPEETAYSYPPLWGPNSYNDGAGLFRLSNFAGFVKNNMPYLIASHKNPALTNEEAWDVAAFVNSMPRPHKDQSQDWPNTAKKPIDLAVGPYADHFSENQHKYGPYLPIQAYYQKNKGH